MASGKAFAAYMAHKHGKAHHLHPGRIALGLFLLLLLLLPVVLMTGSSIYCALGGTCVTKGWALVPTCLFSSPSSSSASASSSLPSGTQSLYLARSSDDNSKWRGFLRRASLLGGVVPERSPLALGQDPSSDGTAQEAFPPEQWQAWELPPRMLGSFPDPENARLDPSLFHLHIKFLTFDRVNTTLRCLRSLIGADYEGDAVSLEIFLDHPYHQSEAWRKRTDDEVHEAMQRRLDMLDALDRVAWPHGPKSLLTRSLNMGIQPQWMEAFWPENVNEFAFIVEDDTEVSPYFYIYLKRLIMHYYYTKSNFNPNVYGISFQRQWFVPAKGGNPMQSPPDPFLYQLVGTWGQVVFPIPWKDFRVWYDIARYRPGLEPVIDNMVTTIFWFKKGQSIWTHYQVHWAHVRGYFNLYTGFPGNLSLSVCHRTAGVNIKRTLGPDTAMITREVLHSEDIPATERDPASGLPLWWTRMPRMSDMRMFDFCFRQLPNWRRTVMSFEELRRALPAFNATQELAVIPVSDSTSFMYKLIRNWLCHLDGTALHNYMFLFTLHPLRDQHGGECMGAAQQNAEMVEMARDLALRNHLVYIQDELAQAGTGGPTAGGSAGGSTGSTGCVDSEERLFLTRVQAELVQRILDLGIDVLVSGPRAFWRVNPFECLSQASARHRIYAISRLVKASPSAQSYSGSVVWVQGSKKGSSKWRLFQELWDKYRVPRIHGLPDEAAEDALKLLHGFSLKATGVLSTVATRECIVAAPWKPANDGAMNATSPAIIMTPGGDTVASIKELNLWQLHDYYNSCSAIRCTPWIK